MEYLEGMESLALQLRALLADRAAHDQPAYAPSWPKLLKASSLAPYLRYTSL